MRHPTEVIRNALIKPGATADEATEAVIEALTAEGFAVVSAADFGFLESEVYGAGCIIATLSQELESASRRDSRLADTPRESS